jgi:ParB family chromosome partitioning protein
MSEPAPLAARGSNRTSRKRRFSVDSLFEDTTPRAVGVKDFPSAKEIRLERIEADPDQPRRTFDDERLEELADSIRQEGVLQPIAVRYTADRDCYVILHGERRWRAAKLAGLSVIPAIVRDVPEERRLIQQLMENVVREDLNAVDRAAALRALKAQMDNAPWERVADAVGIKRSRLFQLLGTEKLPAPVQEEIRAGRLSEKQSRVLQGLATPVQEALSLLITSEGLGQNEAQRLARAVHDDPEFARMPSDQLIGRLRAMREVAEARPVNRRGHPDLAGALSRVLGEDPGEAGAPAYIGQVLEREGMSPLTRYQLDDQITAIAVALAQLPSAPLPIRERRQITARLRALQSLITAALAPQPDV